ncbi:MAG: hypothetical protein J7M27_12105, partial [Candidatus Latescibacteria bacterium]|nr:hypothetical protein [Candidatus Latescibacterota bacterium]
MTEATLNDLQVSLREPSAFADLWTSEFWPLTSTKKHFCNPLQRKEFQNGSFWLPGTTFMFLSERIMRVPSAHNGNA